MAMTKKERAEFDAAIERARILGALRWTEKVETDVPIPESGEGLRKGFLCNDYSASVEPACSNSIHHSFGRSDKADSQCPSRLYSTKLRALKAVRHLMELRYAKELAKIDARIEKEAKSVNNQEVNR